MVAGAQWCETETPAGRAVGNACLAPGSGAQDRLGVSNLRLDLNASGQRVSQARRMGNPEKVSLKPCSGAQSPSRGDRPAAALPELQQDAGATRGCWGHRATEPTYPCVFPVCMHLVRGL